MTFHVGQKVLCVNDSRIMTSRKRGWFRFLDTFELLDHNLKWLEIYTVTHIGTIQDCLTGQRFDLLNVAEAVHFKFPQIGFPSYQFRPLVEKKTDISVFTEILDRESAQPRKLVPSRLQVAA